MFIRNYKGEIVEFQPENYYDEKTLYTALWKILYNIDFAKISTNSTENLINFIR